MAEYHQSELTAHRIRFAALDALDEHLVRLTGEAYRGRLAPFLFMYSRKLLVSDDPDWPVALQADVQHRFGQLRNALNAYRSGSRFLLSDAADLHRDEAGNARLHAQVQLGRGVAERVLIEPFFTREERAARLIDVEYQVPSPERSSLPVLDALRRSIGEHALAVDSPMLVNGRTMTMYPPTTRRPALRLAPEATPLGA